MRSLTVLSRFGLVSKYIMRFLISLLYVEVTISMEVCKFSLWIAKNELHANAKTKEIELESNNFKIVEVQLFCATDSPS